MASLADITQVLLENRRIKKRSTCWEWTRSLSTTGYGRRKYNGKYVSVHRLAAVVWKGFNLKSKKFICHTCDNKKCFNPTHLFIGTNQDNQVDARNKGLLPTGLRSPVAKFNSQAQLARVRKLRRTGKTLAVIAQQFNVGISTVHRLTRGETYADTRRYQNSGKFKNLGSGR